MKNKKSCFNILMLFLFLFFTLSCAHAEPAAEPMIVEASPSFLSVTAKGDREKFEEDHWVSRNASGGIDNLSLSKKLNDQDSLNFDGRAILGNHDYNSNLTLAREGVGSLNFGFKEYRKYFDGTGGHYSGFANYTPVELDKDLNLDIGGFKLEGILAKEDAPEYSLSYERDFREGSKSVLRWLRVTGPGSVSRNINPTYLDTNEKIDRVKLGVKHETKDSLASAEQLWESTKVKNNSIYSQTYTIATGVLGNPSIQDLHMDSDRYATTLRYAKDLNDKLTASCGLLYNHEVAGSLENLNGSTNRDNPASIEQNSVTLVPNFSFTPFKSFLMSFASKAEFNNKNGTSSNNTATTAIDIESNTYSKIFIQSLELKYSGMKDIVWFADGEFEKSYKDQFEEQSASPFGSGSNNFSRKSDIVSNITNYTVGCKWYPISKLSLTLQGKNRDGFTDNKHEFLTGDIVSPTLGDTYRGFIDTMTYYTRSPSAKLKYKPFKWLASNLGYTYDSTVYGIRTRVSEQTMKSKYYAHIYSGEITLTPYEYLYCSFFYERKNATTKTAADRGTIPLYNADVDVYRFNYGYALTKNISMDGGYSAYNTANFNDFNAAGIPLGLDNTAQDIFLGLKHSLNKDSSCALKYTYSMYDEDSNNNVDDYEAHLISVAMSKKF